MNPGDSRVLNIHQLRQCWLAVCIICSMRQEIQATRIEREIIKATNDIRAINTFDGGGLEQIPCSEYSAQPWQQRAIYRPGSTEHNTSIQTRSSHPANQVSVCC